MSHGGSSYCLTGRAAPGHRLVPGAALLSTSTERASDKPQRAGGVPAAVCLTAGVATDGLVVRRSRIIARITIPPPPTGRQAHIQGDRYRAGTIWPRPPTAIIGRSLPSSRASIRVWLTPAIMVGMASGSCTCKQQLARAAQMSARFDRIRRRLVYPEDGQTDDRRQGEDVNRHHHARYVAVPTSITIGTR